MLKSSLHFRKHISKVQAASFAYLLRQFFCDTGTGNPRTDCISC